MPNLHHNAEYERHLMLAALAHCPRDYWLTDQVRRGLLVDPKAGDSLALGILVHYGLEALWKQRLTGEAIWTPSLALDALEATPEAASVAKLLLDEAKKAIIDYAEQWTGVRDHWKPLEVAPLSIPPDPWTVLAGKFVAYPDLIVNAGPVYPVVVVDHKTSMWKFEANKWEWHPELLTQCLAAKQRWPESHIFYMIDYLQRPGKKSNVWSFPATPIWEFTGPKAMAAASWIDHLIERRDDYRERWYESRVTLAESGRADLEGATVTKHELPWPQELSQCQTAWGLCKWYGGCFGNGSSV